MKKPAQKKKTMTIAQMSDAAVNAGGQARIELVSEGDGKVIEFTRRELMALRDRACLKAADAAKTQDILLMREWYTLAGAAEHLALRTNGPEYTLAVKWAGKEVVKELRRKKRK